MKKNPLREKFRPGVRDPDVVCRGREILTGFCVRHRWRVNRDGLPCDEANQRNVTRCGECVHYRSPKDEVEDDPLPRR